MGNLVAADKSKIDASSYEVVKIAADFILSETDVRPKIGLVCGTGMSSVPKIIDVKKEFDYADIPHFPKSTVSGHEGKLLLGYIGGVPVICMKGRVHYFEGYSLAEVVMPVRVMKLCGITHLIMSNAAGGLNESFKTGDVMIIKDHINVVGLSGANPLRGANDERWGMRFLPTNNMYDQNLREKGKQAAKAISCESRFHEGIYIAVGGPNFETEAECRMLRMWGADTVGMSTAPEALAAYHCGLKVFAFSIITNMCVMSYESKDVPNHDNIVELGLTMEAMVKTWITKLIDLIDL